ncbi:mCG147522 [Mus musculus]|jgi:hypothetical protein|nr:mCG147522 [Mus musculus]
MTGIHHGENVSHREEAFSMFEHGHEIVITTSVMHIKQNVAVLLWMCSLILDWIITWKACASLSLENDLHQ